jgi:hypothetical protein
MVNALLKATVLPLKDWNTGDAAPEPREYSCYISRKDSSWWYNDDVPVYLR